MATYVQANTNGRLHAADEPSLSPLNRGFLYGDAIYEVWRTYQGVIFGWEEHWQRLEQSAQALYFPLSFSREIIFDEIRKTVSAFRARTSSMSDVYIRLQLYRGEGAIGLDTALSEAPGFVLLVQENKLYTAEKFAAGLTLSVASSLRRNLKEALNPAWKTGNYLNNILCLREARSRGADEVVILNQAGEITEAAVSNIAFVRGGQVHTPPLAAGILAGITRRLLLERIAPEAGIVCQEVPVAPADLAECSEAFLLSTTKDITPISSIDQRHFQGPRTVTLRLKQGFADFVNGYISAHPELRLF